MGTWLSFWPFSYTSIGFRVGRTFVLVVVLVDILETEDLWNLFLFQSSLYVRVFLENFCRYSHMNCLFLPSLYRLCFATSIVSIVTTSMFFIVPTWEDCLCWDHGQLDYCVLWPLNSVPCVVCGPPVCCLARRHFLASCESDIMDWGLHGLTPDL